MKTTTDRREIQVACKCGHQLTVEQWLEICKHEGLKINPETAEVTSRHVRTCDPYGLGLDIPKEYDQIGRENFARRPEGDIWVHFCDLPEDTGRRLWERPRSRLPMPPETASLLRLFAAQIVRELLAEEREQDARKTATGTSPEEF